jgi:glyoxylase-like metal-dependent hydrolase (beta-lactamase superfamily II)
VKAAFAEVGAGVFVLRYPVLDVNSTLVVGDGAALVVDTLSTAPQAALLRDAVRRLTPAPLTVVNTHHHFDHCFGNATLAAHGHGPIWAHEEAAALLREQAVRLQRRWYDEWAPVEPELARDLARVEVLPPSRTVHLTSTVEVGGRPVMLRHLGRGHTAGDLVVHVPDAAAVVAGDLVEESGPPSFEDAFPLEWPEALAELLRLDPAPEVVVPGHGAVVDRSFVAGQHADLTALAWLIRDGHADAAPAAAVAARAPFSDAALTAVRRGYAELDGAL